jgi:hypothetical protein
MQSGALRSQGHPTKNACSTEVLLDFCTRATFLQSVQTERLDGCSQTDIENVLQIAYNLFLSAKGIFVHVLF